MVPKSMEARSGSQGVGWETHGEGSHSLASHRRFFSFIGEKSGNKMGENVIKSENDGSGQG